MHFVSRNCFASVKQSTHSLSFLPIFLSQEPNYLNGEKAAKCLNFKILKVLELVLLRPWQQWSFLCLNSPLHLEIDRGERYFPVIYYRLSCWTSEIDIFTKLFLIPFHPNFDWRIHWRGGLGAGYCNTAKATTSPTIYSSCDSVAAPPRLD